MKIISLYELLRLIKDRQAPKKIKVTGNVYEYDDEFEFYYTKEKAYRVALGGKKEEINLMCNAFNKNIEIIEEDKKIEKIPNDYYHENQDVINQQFKIKINKLIDKINKLEKEGNK